jgi:predicted metalloprotease with PDZ domain
MIVYSVRIPHPHRHFIHFEGQFETHGASALTLQQAAWRPGRYELGNFAKNIHHWHCTDENHRPLPFRKTTKDTWVVQTQGANRIIIRYAYYAHELNAGSTYLDEDQIQINPVNCFFFRPDRQDLPYTIHFELPPDYDMACGLEQQQKHTVAADNFDQLADAPLIASSSLHHLSYDVDNTTYHIWIQGRVKLDEARLLAAFQAFTESQLHIFGDLPCDDYHFLFQFPPYFVRHGVEHTNSTLIAMGPAADFQQDHLFNDLLGISCHELFHTWNIKNIRPVEMMPYDYTRENYSQLGYVAEGVTTYYGDMLLHRCGLFSDQEWCEVLADWLQKHFDNNGRNYLSVAGSSLDTWLDGYTPGIPWRKVSIYNEGALIALITDAMIRFHTKHTKSLDDVMRAMYERFGKKQKGYSDNDYMTLVNEVAGIDLSGMFNDIVYDTKDYEPFITAALSVFGYEMQRQPANKYSEATFGLSLDESLGKATVTGIVQHSPADEAGLWIGDDIISINGVSPYKNTQHLLKQFEGELNILFVRKGEMRQTQLWANGQVWGYKIAVNKSNR